MKYVLKFQFEFDAFDDPDARKKAVKIRDRYLPLDELTKCLLKRHGDDTPILLPFKPSGENNGNPL
jgi:hypothetical protein